MKDSVLLSEPESPLRVEYSRAAMEEIRGRARDGLMAAPRVGVGVGGLLLGVREGGRTRIVDSLEIPCCHSGGPSFKLTSEEMQQAREMMAEASDITATTRVAVVGWYCSKTRGDAVLNEFDRQFHDELFPDAWQIALVLRPSAAEPMRAVFYFRDEAGAVNRGVESEVDQWASPAESDASVAAGKNGEAGSAEVARGEARPGEIRAVEPPARPAAKVIEMSPPPRSPDPPPPALSTRPQETTLADIIGAGAVEAGAPVRSRAANADLFGQAAFPPRPKSNSKLIVAGVVAAVVVLATGGAWFTRDSWLPIPPVNLTSSDVDGKLLIRWNPEALKAMDHGTMYISDGSGKPPESVPLDRFQLGSGLLNYTLKTKQVTATLDAGSVHERTVWFAPPTTPAPAAGNGTLPATSPPAPAETKPILTAPAQDTPKP